MQGAYASREMEAQIENAWEQLIQVILDTFDEIPRSGVSSSRDESWRSAENPAASAQNAGMDDNHAEQAMALRLQLERLVQGLVDGRISESTFLELKADIERQLQYIEHE